MIDVMQHKLVGSRIVTQRQLENATDPKGYAKEMEREIAQDLGTLILERWPLKSDGFRTTKGEFAGLRATVFVFSPAELAQLISDVRDKAIEETMALANTLISEQEKPDEQ